MIKLASHQHLWFTGFMATGKSRIGALVAEKLERHFVDTDRIIEERAGMSVSEIFASQGEEEFRRLEQQVIRDLCQKQGLVISLGGGALTSPGISDLIRQHGYIICLWAQPHTLSERIGRKSTRPLLAGLEAEERLKKIKEMLTLREPLYQLADFHVESTDQICVEQVAHRVIDTLNLWTLRQVTVSPSEARPYPIFIGHRYLRRIELILRSLNLFPQNELLVVTDQNVAQKQPRNLKTLSKICNHRQFRFPVGEKYKSLQILNRLYTFMLRREFGRKTCLLQFGGGVVGDMAGFGAATYQRGIPFVQIPTTLLSMVDSSVGGKVAVNHPEGKNMIGAFYQPQAVLIDLEVLDTLPPEEYRSGLAEVVKYGVIYDEEFFAFLEQNTEQIMHKEASTLTTMIRRCCEIKADVVGQDEKEQGLRAILNYGHTFGHAIEKITQYSHFSHGLAVGLGMRVAARLACLLKLWSPEEEARQNRLLDALEIPSHFKISPAEAWEAMGIDKKVDKSNRVYILPTRIGAVQKVTNADPDLVAQAWQAIAPEENNL